jgi:hypothetical protein
VQAGIVGNFHVSFSALLAGSPTKLRAGKQGLPPVRSNARTILGSPWGLSWHSALNSCFLN